MPAFSLPALLRAVLVWLVIIVAESAHGAIRRLLFSPEATFTIRQLSVLVGAIMIFAITWVFLDWIRIRTARGALAIGAVWVVLTAAFEVALGRLTGLGWDRILADYDLTRGGLMGLGLLAMGLTPWAVRQLQDGRAARRHRALARKLGRAP
ncbi:hypothetical protein [uncultured Phenylobacterium sp.]|uniref:hypothetical protein n=1 Tax=uncultured Phenylobacterium sp. TaxID=349273 RepID=UPI0025E632F0|nr:hypothetical protein [uncultured Phenylobacterium sp.]